MTHAAPRFVARLATAFFLLISMFSLRAQTAPDSLATPDNATGIPATAPADSKSQPAGVFGGLSNEGAEGLVLHPAMKGVTVDMDERNDLFLQVENPIRIKVNGAPAPEISCRIIGEGVVLEKISDTSYIARASQPGAIVLEVVRKTDTAEVVVGGRGMNVKPLPRPSAFFAGKNTGSITKKEALKLGKTLTAEFNKLPFPLSAPVESYLLTIVLPEKAGTPTWPVRGADLPEAAKKGIKDAPDGSILFFDEIMVRMPGETAPRMITGLVLEIKD
jgi:hypothetical protein